MGKHYSAIELADQLCRVVLAIREFGETNSPYLTRLRSEVFKKDWRLGGTRRDRIVKELDDRHQEILVLLENLRKVLQAFGDPLTGSGRRNGKSHQFGILQAYWDEAHKVLHAYANRALTIQEHLGVRTPITPFEGSL